MGKNEEELADILEVLDAIIEENHFSWDKYPGNKKR